MLYLLVQVGGLSNEKEPFDRQLVVNVSLVSYPSKQVYSYESWYKRLSDGTLVLSPAGGTPQDISK